MAAIELLTNASYATHPALWDELFRNDPIQYPLGSPLDQEYSRAYASDADYQDVSLIAMMGDKPAAGLQITKNAGETNFFGRPAVLRTNSSVTSESLEKAEKMLAQEALNSGPLDYLELCSGGGYQPLRFSYSRKPTLERPSIVK